MIDFWIYCRTFRYYKHVWSCTRALKRLFRTFIIVKCRHLNTLSDCVRSLLSARRELQLMKFFVLSFKNFLRALLCLRRKWFCFSKRIVATFVVNVSFLFRFVLVEFERWSCVRRFSTFFLYLRRRVFVFRNELRRRSSLTFLLSLFVSAEFERRSCARRFSTSCSISFFQNVRFKFIRSMNSILKNISKFFLLVS